MNPFRDLNHFEQLAHSNWGKAWLNSCCFKSDRLKNCFPQSSHLNGFSFVWILIWHLIFDASVILTPQIEHSCHETIFPWVLKWEKRDLFLNSLTINKTKINHLYWQTNTFFRRISFVSRKLLNSKRIDYRIWYKAVERDSKHLRHTN